jgi:hypothetical protein
LRLVCRVRRLTTGTPQHLGSFGEVRQGSVRVLLPASMEEVEEDRPEPTSISDDIPARSQRERSQNHLKHEVGGCAISIVSIGDAVESLTDYLWDTSDGWQVRPQYSPGCALGGCARRAGSRGGARSPAARVSKTSTWGPPLTPHIITRLDRLKQAIPLPHLARDLHFVDVQRPQHVLDRPLLCDRMVNTHERAPTAGKICREVRKKIGSVGTVLQITTSKHYSVRVLCSIVSPPYHSHFPQRQANIADPFCNSSSGSRSTCVRSSYAIMSCSTISARSIPTALWRSHLGGAVKEIGRGL